MWLILGGILFLFLCPIQAVHAWDKKQALPMAFSKAAKKRRSYSSESDAGYTQAKGHSIQRKKKKSNKKEPTKVNHVVHKTMFIIPVVLVGVAYIMYRRSWRSDSSKPEEPTQNKNHWAKTPPTIHFIVQKENGGNELRPYLVIDLSEDDEKESLREKLLEGLRTPLYNKSNIACRTGLECLDITEKTSGVWEDSRAWGKVKYGIAIFCQKHNEDDPDHTEIKNNRGYTIGENLQRVQYEIVKKHRLRYVVDPAMRDNLKRYYEKGNKEFIKYYPMLEGTDQVLEWLEGIAGISQVKILDLKPCG